MKYINQIENYYTKDKMDALYNAKVFDADQFIHDTLMKVEFAAIEYNSILYIDKVLKENKEKWLSDLKNNRSTTALPDTTIEYFSMKIPSNILIKKIVYNFFNYLHESFDVLAQFINRSLLANKALEIEEVSIYKISAALKNIHRYNSVKSRIDSIKEVNKEWFDYICDYSNINKHHYNMDILIKNYINIDKIEASIPEFYKTNKKGKFKSEVNVYDKEELIVRMDMCLENTLKYITGICDNIFEILSTNEHEFNKLRFHDIKNYAQVSKSGNKDDEGSNSFIITDDNLKNEDIIRILEVDCEDKRYLARNMELERLFVRNSNGELVGTLVKEDEIRVSHDIFKYRKYKVIKVGETTQRDLAIDFFFKPKTIHPKNEEIRWVD